jgi:hypothetical protein
MHTFQQLPLQSLSSWRPLLSHGPPLPVLARGHRRTLQETLADAIHHTAREGWRPAGTWRRASGCGQATMTGVSCLGTTRLVVQQEHAVHAASQLRAEGFPPGPLQRLQLQPREIHVWWLFPEDVRATFARLHRCTRYDRQPYFRLCTWYMVQ